MGRKKSLDVSRKCRLCEPYRIPGLIDERLFDDDVRDDRDHVTGALSVTGVWTRLPCFVVVLSIK